MAVTKKTAKKATKKVDTKKNTVKRKYVRKAKPVQTETPAVEQEQKAKEQVEVPIDWADGSVDTLDIRDLIIESQRAEIKSYRNSVTLHDRLHQLGDEVLIDLQHLNAANNRIGKALIAEALIRSKYEVLFPSSDEMFTLVLKADILVLNTIRRTVHPIAEHCLTDGTILHRLSSKEFELAITLEGGRTVQTEAIINGVRYLRA